MQVSYNLDKVLGLFHAHFIGDALGAAYEFKTSNFANYNGLIFETVVWRSQWQGTKTGPSGQTTDDTAMTLCLLSSLLANNGVYNRDNTIKLYHEWASGNAGGVNEDFHYTRMIGTNTAELFKYKVKPENVIKSYEHRFNKKFFTKSADLVNDVIPSELRLSENALNAQSNGCLMRCTPFVIIDDWQVGAKQDCYLTNPNELCWECCKLYIIALKHLLEGKPGMEIYQLVRSQVTINEILEVFIQVEQQQPRNLKEQKGWILNAFYCVLVALIFNGGLQDFYDWLIPQRGDTDTNACIAGAIIGVKLGFNQILLEDKTKHNWTMVINCNISNSELDTRPVYQGQDLSQYLQQLGFT